MPWLRGRKLCPASLRFERQSFGHKLWSTGVTRQIDYITVVEVRSHLVIGRHMLVLLDGRFDLRPILTHIDIFTDSFAQE